MEKYQKWLIAIFFITLATRLVLSFTIPNFTYDSYFHLEQIQHIKETGLPLYDDPLSYGGREFVFLPFFHYLLALFSLVLPLEIAAKILPNLLLATLPLFVFLIANKITKFTTASLFSAGIAGFLPIIFQTNEITTLSLFLPLITIAIYAFMNLKKPKYFYIYFVSLFILSLTSSSVFLLLIGLGIYLLMSLTENKRIKRKELEVIIFSSFFFLWLHFIFFKNLFIKEGIGFIWQNVPPQIISEYFPKLPVVEAVFLVSFVPLLAGIFVVYRSLFKLKNRKAFLVISLAISTIFLTSISLIEFKLALSFLGVILAILFAIFYVEATSYLKTTKADKFRAFFPWLVAIVLILTMVIPAVSAALTQPTPSKEEVQTFQWINKYTPENSGVLSLLEEGRLVTYYSKRKNLMDNQFSLIEDVEERFGTLNSLYSTSFETLALEASENYGLNYLVLTPAAQKRYGIEKFKYISRECFERVYTEESIIYRVTCKLREQNEK